MADNFDNYSMKVQARVDMPSNKDIDAQIRKLEKSISKLKVSGQFDDTALKNLTNQLNSLKATVSTANFSPAALTELTSQVEKALGNIQISAKVGQEVGSAITKGMQQNIDTGVVGSIKKISDSTTSTVVQNEKKKQDAYRATTETVMYHAGVVSKLNKAETNGRFYGSSRGTGYFGTGHYFVDSATKHELDNNSSYSKLPYTSIDISKYDNLFKANTDEIANRLHSFLENLTKFTQGSDVNSVSELFSQFRKVFGDTVMDMQKFDAKLEQLKSFMQNSNMSDRSDSVSTQFMKSLGYGGVDTRGTKYADTRYGTVIYDLKEESVLQANITDELQKQGQMLEKINYEKGQVFDKTEDSRIQSIIDQQAKSKEIETEFDKLFDSTKIKAYESELDSVNETLKKNDDIISDCQHAINNADEEAKKFAKDMANLGLEMSEDEIKSQADDYRVTFQERIDELEKERPLLESRKKQLEENLNAEYELANVAREQARQIVDERHKEVQSVQEVSDKIKSFSELKIKSNDFVDIDGLTKAEDILEKVRAKYEQFGQVTFKNIELDADGNLKSFRVNIQQTNGDLKETRNFLMEISDDAKKVKFSDDTIKGTENVVRHLNEQKDATDEIIKEEQKLANAMANVREKSEQARQAEEKHQELAQNKAINKALEEEYNQKQKIIAQEEKLAQATAEKANKIQLSSDVTKLTTDYQKFGVVSQEVENNLKELKLAQESVVNAKGTDRLATEIEKYDTALEKAKSSWKELSATQVSLSQRTSQMTSMQEWMRKNSAATKLCGDRVRELIAECQTCNKVRFDQIKNEFKQIQVEAGKAGKLGNSFLGSLKDQAKSFTQWISVSGAVMKGVQTARQMYQAVYDIDTAMTNLYKVTDETDIKYNKFLNSACDNAQRLGRSVSSLIEQTANWAKLGYSIDESEQLAQISSIYANVGEVDDATAVSDIVTVMKAYDIAAEDAIQIVNKYNKLGNEFATSAKDLGEGLSNAASMLALGGTDVNKALALLTGGAEITQSAGELGTALKIGQMRVQGMKGKLEELGETVDENVESISKMQTHILNLTKGEVNIFDENNNFKDYYDILEEVSKVIDKLSDTERADLLETLFGKNRGNQGAAVLQAFQSGQVQKALEATLNAEGSAMQEQERWMQSLEAKTQQFEAAFQSLSNTILDSDLVKFFVDLGTTGVKAIDGLVNALGGLGTIGLLGGAGLGIKNVGINTLVAY